MATISPICASLITLYLFLLLSAVGQSGTTATISSNFSYDDNAGTYRNKILLNNSRATVIGDTSDSYLVAADAVKANHDLETDSNLILYRAHIAATKGTLSRGRETFQRAKETPIKLELKAGHVNKHRLPLYEPLILRPRDTPGVKMIVGSMTSTPSRLLEINGALGDTLRKLLSFKSLDMVYLNIPWSYGMRQKHVNYKLSSDMQMFLANADGRLTILRCNDYGPSTKLLPLMLLSEEELPGNATIITFDDDRLYEESAVLALLEVSLVHPKAAITIAAWPIGILSSNGRRGMTEGPNFKSKISGSNMGIQYKKRGSTDLVLGFFGVSYKKSFFLDGNRPDPHLFNYSVRSEFSSHCAWVDDVWFSGHLERLNISKIVVGKKSDTTANPTKLSNIDALSLDEGESVKQNRDNVLCAEAMSKEYGIWG